MPSRNLSAEGHCAYPYEDLVTTTSKLLEITKELATSGLNSEIEAGNLIREEIEGEKIVYLAALYKAETGVAMNLLRLVAGKCPWGPIDGEKAIPWVEEKNRIQLSESQKNAVKRALLSKVLVITGGPGVGKTTLVNSILKILRAKRLEVLLCAPTGRAAKRLSESTGIEAKTIHRLLEFDGKAEDLNARKKPP